MQKSNELLEKVKAEKYIIYYCKGTEKMPPYAYSLGLQHNFNHPELILMDGEKDWLISFLNDKCIRVVQAYEKKTELPDFTLSEKYKTSKFLMNTRVRENGVITAKRTPLGLVKVSDSRKKELCRRAHRFYLRLSSFDVVQLVIADSDFLLPWDRESSSQILLCD